jgi:Mce-associated membrane protein
LPADALPEAGDLATRAAAERLPWGLLTFVALTVVTLVCGGLATWFGTQAGAVTSAPSASNHALSDPGETSQVTSQVTGAVQRLFSYDYANPAPTQNAAAALLTGVAVKQYATLFAAVKQAAMKNKLVVTTTVSQAGVETLSGGTARVLVFATESNGSAGASAPTTAEAMLAVNAVRTGSAWKIEGLDTFTR